MMQVLVTINGIFIELLNITNLQQKVTCGRGSSYQVEYKGDKIMFAHYRKDGALICTQKAIQAIINYKG